MSSTNADSAKDWLANNQPDLAAIDRMIQALEQRLERNQHLAMHELQGSQEALNVLEEAAQKLLEQGTPQVAASTGATTATVAATIPVTATAPEPILDASPLGATTSNDLAAKPQSEAEKQARFAHLRAQLQTPSAKGDL